MPALNREKEVILFRVDNKLAYACSSLTPHDVCSLPSSLRPTDTHTDHFGDGIDVVRCRLVSRRLGVAAISFHPSQAPACVSRTRAHALPQGVDHHDGEGMLAASSVKWRGHSGVMSEESVARGARDNIMVHLQKRMSGRGKERGWECAHDQTRESSDWAAFRRARRNMIQTDAEQPKHGEADGV
jgi:hypothetical protein